MTDVDAETVVDDARPRGVIARPLVREMERLLGRGRTPDAFARLSKGRDGLFKIVVSPDA